jgi:Mn2+/Fe2+ NRAMP family transporter
VRPSAWREYLCRCPCHWRGSYRSAERIFIWFTIPFFAYPIAAILAHPHWGAVGKAIVAPQLHSNSTYLLLLIATAGTTITPYMQLYLQSAVVERGVREEELRHEEREAVSGAVFANVVASFIIIATGATLYTHGIHDIGSAADAARALNPFAGRYAEVLFGVGLLGASLLAAAILPIATSYVISESLGYEKGVGRRRQEAPVFVNIITAMIMIAAFVAIIPGVPVISLLVAVQVVNGVLLPINLFFIWRLARSKRVMGERRSRGLLDGAAGVTVAVTSTLSIALVVVTVLSL